MEKISYKDAGVNIHAGYESVEYIKNSTKKTFNKNVMTGIGSFAGLYRLSDYKKPVLVSGTDGVGTKLMVAQILDRHETIGQDLVAMCVNDILCHGAKPLFFLDYIALGKLDPKKVGQIVDGISNACKEVGAALIGGETAEMPGMYKEDDYDLAGFCVGAVEEDEIIDGSTIAEGDILIGIESNGIHSNGYSLVRKLFVDKFDLNEYRDDIKDTLANELMKPTHLYVEPILKAMETISIKGMAHITGGGFIENIPRMFKHDYSAQIFKDSFQIKPIFKLIKKLSNLEENEMFNTFNMGIGMVVCLDKNDSESFINIMSKYGLKSNVIGQVVEGSKEVIL
jgi:phosphoribosylformylglycinamidine cyclo-ligase